MLHKALIVFLSVVLVMPINAYPFSHENLDLKVQAGISEIYDDNITYREADEIDDFITDLSLGIGIGIEGKTAKFDLMANVTQQLFADNDDFNNTSEDLTINYQQDFSKYDRISLSDTFSHTYEPRSFEEAFGRTTGHYSYYRNRFNFMYEKDLSKQLGLRLNYKNEIDEISRDDLSDSMLNGAGIEAVYYPSSANILYFGYNFTKRDFDPGAKASMHTIVPALRHYFTKKTYIDMQAGVDFIDSYTNKEYTKPLITGTITHDIDENSQASISFGKRYYTVSYSEDLFDYWQLSGVLSKQITKRMSGSVNGFYGEGEYIEAGVADKLSGIGASLSYDVSKKSKISLDYTYSQVDSDDPTREYNKNRLMVSFRMKF